MIVNQENFCRHYCEDDYDKIIKEQEEDCQLMVECSVLINGMNPDAACAQGLMLKLEEELFEDALMNFAKLAHHQFVGYNQGRRKDDKISFKQWWDIEGKELLDAIREKK